MDALADWLADPIGPDRIRSDPIGSAADPPRTKSADYSPDNVVTNLVHQFSRLHNVLVWSIVKKQSTKATEYRIVKIDIVVTNLVHQFSRLQFAIVAMPC